MASFTNIATLSYNGNTVNSNIVTGEIQETLTATKTAVRGTYTAGDDITYIVTITNTGATAYTGLTITDNSGAYTAAGAGTVYPLTYVTGAIRYFVNGVLQAAPAVTAGPPMVITGIDVPAGGTAVIIYEVTVNDYAPMATGSTITNTVTITGTGITTPLTADETVQVRNEPMLTITKALTPAVVTENGQITYTFTIQNYGNTAVTTGDDTVLADTFNPILTIQSVTFDGAAWANPTNYTYNTGNGQFATVRGQITVRAATFTQNVDGTFAVEPGVATLVVTGTI